MANPPFDTTPQQPEPTGPDYRQIMQDASTLRAAGWTLTRINAYLAAKHGITGGVPGLVGLATDQRNRALQASGGPDWLDTAHENGPPGPVATAATHFGDAASMGWSAKLAGLYDAIDAISAGPQATEQAYQGGKQAQQSFLQQGAQANPGVARGARLAGTIASAVPAFEGASSLGARLLNPGLAATAARGAAAGGGMEEAQRLGAGQPFSLPNLLKASAIGAGGNAAGQIMRTAGNPASWRFDRAIEADGGPEALQATRTELQQQGVQPLPAEFGPSLRGEALKFIPRASENARAAAAKAIQTQVEALERRRLAVTSGPNGYDAVLAAPAKLTPRLQLLLADPDVAPIVRRGIAKGRLPADINEWTGRDVFWLKKQMNAGARSAYQGPDQAAGEVLRGGTNAVNDFLSQNFPGYDGLQRQVAQLKTRARDLQLLQRTVTGRTGVNMRGRVRPTVGTGIHHQMLEEAGLDLFERNRKAANTMVRTLFDPNLTVEDLMARVNALRSRLFITPHEGGLFQRMAAGVPSAIVPATGQAVTGPDAMGLYGHRP